MSALCEAVRMSRQNFYKNKKRRERKQVDEEMIVQLVKGKRRLHPRMGGRKLLHLLREDLREAGADVGRCRFFEILRAHGLLIERRRRAPRTTFSRHGMPTYENLLKDREPQAPHQAWVSDLTYIRTREGFMYLSLITDAYSRKIVGYDIGDSLEASGCLRALEGALEQLPEGADPIHHSDRGTQYCCGAYVGRLRENGISVSMTEEDHCYENAMAERMNGILKQEYGLGHTFVTKADAVRAAHQAAWLYNNERPHMSLQMQKPNQVHRQAA